MKYFCAFLFWVVASIANPFFVFCQTLRYNTSMPYLSSSAYNGKQIDAFSITGNQAALARLQDPAFGVYGERRFLLTENSAYSMVAVVPTKKGNFGFQLNYAGFAGFREYKSGLAYARSLGKLVDVGIQFNYYGYRISQYGNTAAINVEMGILLHFTEQLTGGIHVYNPVGGMRVKMDDEKLASAYKFGLGYEASPNCTISTEVAKEENRNVNVTGAAQYQFMKQLFVRLGFVSQTGSGFASIGLGWNNMRLDISGSYHPQLGLSPGLLLLVNFKKANNEL